MERNIILGTDWWTDCDDIAAVRILCRAHKKGLWTFRGAVLDACMPYSVPSLDAFIRSEGLTDVPLAADRDADDFTGTFCGYQEHLAGTLPHVLDRTEDAEEPVPFLKRILSDCPDGTAELIEIGFPQVWAALLRDPEGYALIEAKVRKLWMMAGRWDNGGRGFEHNICNNPRSREGAAYVLEHFPRPVVFLGWEVGADVISGGDPEDDSDPMVRAFRCHGSPKGRSSWDPMTVLLALADDPERAGYSLRKGRAHADPETGENSFDCREDGLHAYVVRENPPAWYEERLNAWLR